MAAFLKINRPNSVITVALHDYVVKWDQGIQDRTQNQNVTAIIAVRKAS